MYVVANVDRIFILLMLGQLLNRVISPLLIVLILDILSVVSVVIPSNRAPADLLSVRFATFSVNDVMAGRASIANTREPDISVSLTFSVDNDVPNGAINELIVPLSVNDKPLTRTVRCWSPKQPNNISDERLASPLALIVTEVSDVQPLNAPAAMLRFLPALIVTEVSDVQPLKASAPIVISCGLVRFNALLLFPTNELQPLNALAPILTKLKLLSIVTKFVQPANRFAGADANVDTPL